MADGFAVGAAHCLVKPFTQEIVEIAMDRCLYLEDEAERFVEVVVDRGPRRVLLSKVRWAESWSNACTLHLEDEDLSAWPSLEDWTALLNDPRFLRCQGSCLVNLDHVAGMNGSEFLLKDGDLVPVSRESRAAMKAKYEKYLFKKARRRR